MVNESDDLALEQAMLMKEAGGGTVTVVALDFGDVDNTLYAAAAKGADRIVKIPYDQEPPPPPQAGRGHVRRGDPPPGGRPGAGGQSRPTTSWRARWRRCWPRPWGCPSWA